MSLQRLWPQLQTLHIRSVGCAANGGRGVKCSPSFIKYAKPDMLGQGEGGRQVGRGWLLIHLLPAERPGVCNEFFGQVLKSSGCNGILLQHSHSVCAGETCSRHFHKRSKRTASKPAKRMLSQGAAPAAPRAALIDLIRLKFALKQFASCSAPTPLPPLLCPMGLKIDASDQSFSCHRLLLSPGCGCSGGTFICPAAALTATPSRPRAETGVS